MFRTRNFVFCSLLLLPVFSHAQVFTGRVTDSTGAALPKANVTVLNEKTNVALPTKTTSAGVYTVPYLTPGLYTVTAEAAGFSRVAKTEITLAVGQTATIDFALAVGSVTETITVKDDQALLNFNSGDVGEVVENTRVTELPLNGGDPSTLAQLSAGANWYGAKQYQEPFDDTEAVLSINGGGAANNELLLDGTSNEAAKGDEYNGTNGQVGYIPPVSAVQEFKIITNPYDAQYGRASGGVIDMTLKSGTNKIHGTVYEFARRAWLDANTWQNNFYGNPRTNQKRDQYGFELDGPVVFPKLYNGRDKTFFLLQFENWNGIEPAAAVSSVPQPEWLTGDFSKTTYFDGATQSYKPLTIYDPLTLHDNGHGVLVRDPFSGNQIPQGRINPVAQKILSYYAKPNVASTAGLNTWQNNFQGPAPQQNIYRNALAKIDQNFTSRDRFSLRYGFWERFLTANTTGMPGYAGQGYFPHAERSHSFAEDWTHTFSPNLLFDFRASVIVRAGFNNYSPIGFDQSTLGFPSSMIQSLGIFNNVFPNMQISEFTGIGSTGGQMALGNSLAMLPTVTYTKGNHTIHFGIDWRILQASWRYVPGGVTLKSDRTWTQSNYAQGDPASGNSIASFLLGTASDGNVGINPVNFYSQHYYAPFFQDDWKVTRRLTLNLGMRYDLNGPPVDRHNRMDYAFDTTTVNPVNAQVDQSLVPGPVIGGPRFVGVNGAPRQLYSLTKINFGPRFGFAFQADPKTVFRGGFGLMYRNVNPGPSQFGFSATTPYVGSLDGNKTPINNLSNPFPTVLQPQGASQGLQSYLGQGVYWINPHYRTPQFWTFSVGVQKQLFKQDVLEINYVGTRTRFNDSSDNPNHVSAAAYSKCNILLGGDPYYCNNAPGAYVKNPFQGLAPFQGTGYYSSPTIQAVNLTRPFIAFTDLGEYQLNDGKSWYDSLQVTALHKWSNDLTMHATWTWSKMMDSGGYNDAVYRVPVRRIDQNDITHRITLSGVYILPVGRGRQFLGKTNRVVDGFLGGWELGGIYIYETGKPWFLNGQTQYIGNARVDRRADPSIPNSVRGARACAEQYVQGSQAFQWNLTPIQNSGCGGVYNFIANPQYAASPNVNYTGIRQPNYWNIDTNLSKNFKLHDRLTLQTRLDTFNVPNHPVFQQNYDYTPTSPTFGTFLKTSGQTNLQRQVQLAVKILW